MLLAADTYRGRLNQKSRLEYSLPESGYCTKLVFGGIPSNHPALLRTTVQSPCNPAARGWLPSMSSPLARLLLQMGCADRETRLLKWTRVEQVRGAPVFSASTKHRVQSVETLSEPKLAIVSNTLVLKQARQAASNAASRGIPCIHNIFSVTEAMTHHLYKNLNVDSRSES